MTAHRRVDPAFAIHLVGIDDVGEKRLPHAVEALKFIICPRRHDIGRGD